MNNTKKATKKPTINKKPIIISVIAALLAVIIGIGTFLTLDYIYVDTPYDGISMPKHIQVAKYLGAEISRSKVDEKVAESLDALLDEFTNKIKVEKGTIEEGMNVTVSITARLENAVVNEVSYTSYEIADIGKHQAAKDEEFFKALEEHIMKTVTKFDFEGDYINAAPAFTYKYPDNYSVTKVKGKEVVHTILITAVTTTDAPEYNDQFFINNKDEIMGFMGLNVEFATKAEFEAYLRKQIELNMLWNNIVEASKVKKYPEKFIEKYEGEFDAYYEMVMQSNGLTRAQLLSQMGTDEKGYIKERTEYAEKIVKEELILYEIIQAEEIRVSSDEYKSKGATLAKEGDYGDTVKDLENALGEDVAERTIIWEKVKEYILSKAVWTV
jgi:trigger factor